MSLTTISVSRRVTTIMFFVGISLLGVITFSQIGVDFLPDVKIPELLVETDLNGAPPEEIEKSVTRPVEEVLSTVNGKKSVTSISQSGRSLTTVRFYWGTNVDYAMLEAREKLDGVRGALPLSAGRPTIFKIDPSTESIITLAVNYQLSAKSNEQQLAELKDFTEQVVKRRLEQVPGVAQAAVAGGVEREVEVDVDLSKLSSFGLTIDDVAWALKNANVNLEGGTANQGMFRYSLRTIGEFQNISDIEDVAVKRSSESNTVSGFPLRTFACVRESFVKREGMTRLNGKECILVLIKKEVNANAVTVSGRVENVVAQLRKDFPGVSIITIFNEAEFIDKSITDIETAIISGALLALLVLFVFLRDPRYPLLIGIVTPLSILTTIVLMYFSGVSFNIISLTGLALGIGMIGDNAIIIVENFSRLREKGDSVIDSVVGGSKEINLSVAAATFTNVVVFLPIVFVKGLAQKLFLDMGLTMTFSLLASLVVAITIVPSFLSRMKHKAPHDLPPMTYGQSVEPPSLFPSLYRRFMSRYMKSLKLLLDKPGMALGGTAFLTLLALGTAFLIKSEEAPDIDQSRFVIVVKLPPYSNLNATIYLVSRIESTILKMPEIEFVVSDIGNYSSEDYFDVLNSSINFARIECRVKNNSDIKTVIEKARRLLLGTGSPGIQKYSRSSMVCASPASLLNASVAMTSPSTTFERILNPRQSDIEIRIIGDDLSGSLVIADSLLERLKGLGYLTDVGLEGQPTTREIWITVDKITARSYGIDVMDIPREIANLVRGVNTTYFDRFDEKYPIRVIPEVEGSVSSEGTSRDSSCDCNTVQEILDHEMITSLGVKVPLRALVKVEERRGYSSITHVEQQRAIVIDANVKEKGIISAVDDIKALTSKIWLPPEMQIKVGGKIEDISTMFSGLMIIILLSIFLMYVILASLYESMLYPLVILTASPFAAVGTFILMFAFGQTYNLMSIIGIVIMIGAIDNDAVIAVDLIISYRRNGMSLDEAIVEGMRKRFRPILMTTLTAIIGMVPLVLGIGKGLELAAALSYPIIGGLIGSTIFTLFLIPVLYKYFDRLSRTVRKVN